MGSTPLKFAGLITEIIGTLIVSLSVLVLHSRLAKERSFEERLSHQFKLESRLAILGVVVIMAGFIMIIINEAVNE